jgi:Domain of unknown function (DUF4149)
MRAVRYVYILALVVWLGGMVVAGAVVAPAIFSVIQASNPSTGRVLAGRVFGDVLGRFHLVAYGAGVMMLLALALQRAVGPRPPAFGLRAALVAGMLGAMLYSGLSVSPQIDALQQAVAGPMSGLPDEDPRRIEFDTLHGLSSTLLGAVAIGGLILLVWEARE